jgi:hypothetical protein
MTSHIKTWPLRTRFFPQSVNRADCGFVTELHFTQDKLEKEKAIRKYYEDQIAALKKQLASRIETAEDVLNLRRQVKELQYAVADKENELHQLLIQIDKLSLGIDEKQVSQCIPCHEDTYICQSLVLHTTLLSLLIHCDMVHCYKVYLGG